MITESRRRLFCQRLPTPSAAQSQKCSCRIVREQEQELEDNGVFLSDDVRRLVQVVFAGERRVTVGGHCLISGARPHADELSVIFGHVIHGTDPRRRRALGEGVDHFDRLRVLDFRFRRRRHVTVVNVEITEVGAFVHHRLTQATLSTVKRHRVE